MDPLEAKASYISNEPPYGFDLPMLWGGSFSAPALSADNSVQSDATDILEAFMSKPRRNRKQMCPQRAPMYSNTGAVTPDTEDYHQHNSCDRSHRPPRTHRNPISHVAAVAAVTAKVSRATHSTAAARSSGGNAKKSANPCSGPCDNCGARDSPQWRHGSKSKPIVCNACGIRFLRTGSFDKAVDKKRCAATSSVVSGGARLPKRSRADDSSSMEEDEDEQEDEPHMASRSCAHPAASDGGIHSCADSKAAAGGRRVSTPAPEDDCCGQQQQQHDYAMSPAVSSASAYSEGAGPSPLSLGPAATPSSAGGSSRNRAATSSGNSAGRGGQQPEQLRGVVRGPNGRFMSRHGMSPLSNASSGGGASKPSRFGAAAKAGVTSSRLQLAASAAATGAVVPGSGARVPGGESQQPAAATPAAAAAAATAPAASAAAAGVPAVSPVVQLMMNLVGNLGSTEAAIEFINQQVNSKSGAGGPNLCAAAAVIAAMAAGATVTPDLAGAAAGAAAAAAVPTGCGSVCAAPASGSQAVM